MGWKQGLAGCWSLREGYGPRHEQINHLDLLPHGRPATAVVGDRVAVCCSADTQDALLHPDSPLFRLGETPLTVALWVRFDNAPDGFPFLLAKHASEDYFREWALIAAGGTSQRFAFQVFDGSTVIGEAITPGSTLVPGHWHLLLASHDPVSNEVSISLDGGTAIVSTVTGTVGVSTASLALGSDSGLNYYTTANFAGLLLWRRLLDTAEQAEVYNSGWPLLY